MKKKLVHRKKITHASHTSSSKRLHRAPTEKYLVLVRSWVFLVLFAIMLGVGTLAGNVINQQLNGSPTVAGVSTDR